MILYLTNADVVGLEIGGGEIADAIEAALAAESRGAAKNLPKSTIPLADGGLYQATLAAGTILRAHAPAYVADAFIATRLSGSARQTYGQGLDWADTRAIIERASPTG